MDNDYREFVKTWRPFELFTECLTWWLECDYYFNRFEPTEDNDRYFNAVENYRFYKSVIAELGLVEEYNNFRDYVGGNGLYGTE